MSVLACSASRWHATLPHRLAPLPDEWLPGLLLRCDEVNHWSSGMTGAYLFRAVHRSLPRGRTGQPGWIVVPFPALEYLAQLLAIPVEMLLTTTYQAELARLYAPTGPHAGQFSALSSFRVCPACLAEARLLRRTMVFPHLHICPRHQIELVSLCRCGAMLQLFSPQGRPFACHVCGCDWARSPERPALPEQVELEQRVLFCFEFFLTHGTPQLLARALQHIREKLKREKIARVRLLDGKIKQVEHYELTKASLGYLVNLLISLDLSLLDLHG